MEKFALEVLRNIVGFFSQNGIEIIKWGLTTIIGILGTFLGRMWARYDRRREADKIVFTNINNLLPSIGMHHVSTCDFDGLINADAHAFLHRFAVEIEYLENTFLDKKLEEKKKQLTSSVNDFRDKIGLYAFPEPLQNDERRFIRVSEGPDKRNITKLIGQAADKIFKDYSDFYLSAKRRLS